MRRRKPALEGASRGHNANTTRCTSTTASHTSSGAAASSSDGTSRAGLGEEVQQASSIGAKGSKGNEGKPPLLKRFYHDNKFYALDQPPIEESGALWNLINKVSI